MQMLDCWEMQQCMTGLTTTRLLCYWRMNIRKLRRENNIWFSVCEHVCVLYVLCEGWLWMLMLVATTASLNKQTNHMVNKPKNFRHIDHYYCLMTCGTSWKGYIWLEGNGSWRMRGKGWREAREEMEPKEFKGVEKEGESERGGFPCRAVWLAVCSCSARRPWLAK